MGGSTRTNQIGASDLKVRVHADSNNTSRTQLLERHDSSEQMTNDERVKTDAEGSLLPLREELESQLRPSSRDSSYMTKFPLSVEQIAVLRELFGKVGADDSQKELALAVLGCISEEKK